MIFPFLYTVKDKLWSGKQGTDGKGHLNLRENVVVVTIQTQMQGVAFSGGLNAEEHFN